MKKPKTMFTMQMDISLHKNLKIAAVESGVGMADIIVEGLAKLHIKAEEGEADEEDSSCQ